MLVEQLRYNMLLRWFVGLSIEDPIWDATTFTKNRQRFLDGQIAEDFFLAILEQARQVGYVSDEHFTVDGTLIEAWASHKSFRPIDDDEPPANGGKNPTVDFSGTKRSNQTHRSTTDSDARLCRKSFNTTSQMAYYANVLMENRNGLAIETKVVIASGIAERDAALDMIDFAGLKNATLGADKGYDAESLLTVAANAGSRRISLRTTGIDEVRSTGAQRVIPATRSVNENVNVSRKHSGGQKSPVAFARLKYVDWLGLEQCSDSQWQFLTSYES